MNNTPVLKAALLSSSLVFIFGCEKDPKPRELAELEVMWQDPETRKVKDVPGAGKYYRDAYQFRLRAEESYNEGDTIKAKEYAIWSLLKYRTAQAVAQQYEAKTRLDTSNAKLAKLNPELQAVNQERNKLMAEVDGLTRQLNVARRRKADEAKRIAAMKNATTTDTSGTSATDAQKLMQVDARIKAVEAARTQAVSVNAQKHAAAKFNRADNMLKSIRTLRQNTPVPYDTILSSANMAITAFQQSAKEAQPGFKVQVAKSNPAQRRSSLYNDASSMLGTNAVFLESTAVRVVAPRAYLPGSTKINSIGQSHIKAFIGLAKKYDEFNINIEVYTSKGSATENLSVSQVRAKKSRICSSPVA